MTSVVISAEARTNRVRLFRLWNSKSRLIRKRDVPQPIYWQCTTKKVDGYSPMETGRLKLSNSHGSWSMDTQRWSHRLNGGDLHLRQWASIHNKAIPAKVFPLFSFNWGIFSWTSRREALKTNKGSGRHFNKKEEEGKYQMIKILVSIQNTPILPF